MKTKGLNESSLSKADQTRIKILDAGLQVFSELGFDAATTRKIADVAKVSEGLIFRYFGDKRKLLVAIILEEDLKYKGQGAMVQEKDLKTQIENYLLNEIQACQEHRPFVRVAISRGIIDEKIRQDIMARLPIYGDPNLIQCFKQLRDLEKVDARMDPKLLALEVQIYSLGLMLMGAMFDGFNSSLIKKSVRSFAASMAQAHKPKR